MFSPARTYSWIASSSFKHTVLQRSPSVGLRSWWWVGPIHFWESKFMHMSRVCIFSTYFRQLLRLVWLRQQFKSQFLPFLTTDIFKALTVMKFLTISLDERPLSPLKIPFSVPSPLLSVWMLAICLFPHCHAGLPLTSKGSFILCRNSHLPKLNLSVTGSCPGFSGNFWKHYEAFHRAATSHGVERSIQLVLGERWYIFSGRRADSEHKSVGCVSCGRRLVMNTKESQNYDL